jgi:MFS family permease
MIAPHRQPSFDMSSAHIKPTAWLTSYHGVIAVMGMLVMLICNGMVLSGLTPFRFAFAEKYQWQMQQMNFADLVTFGVVGILAPFLGAIMDRTGVRKLMMLGGVMLLVGYFCYAQVTTLFGMYAVHVILGAAVALAGLVPASRLIGRWFELQRGTAMGITLAGSSIASFVFYPLAVKFIAADGIAVAFQKLAWGGLVLTFLAALLVRDRPEDVGLSTFGQSPDRKVSSESQLPGAEFSDVVRSGAFWCLAFGAATTFFAMLGALYNVPAHLVDLGFDRAGTL